MCTRLDSAEWPITKERFFQCVYTALFILVMSRFVFGQPEVRHGRNCLEPHRRFLRARNSIYSSQQACPHYHYYCICNAAWFAMRYALERPSIFFRNRVDFPERKNVATFWGGLESYFNLEHHLLPPQEYTVCQKERRRRSALKAIVCRGSAAAAAASGDFYSLQIHADVKKLLHLGRLFGVRIWGYHSSAVRWRKVLGCILIWETFHCQTWKGKLNKVVKGHTTTEEMKNRIEFQHFGQMVFAGASSLQGASSLRVISRQPIAFRRRQRAQDGQRDRSFIKRTFMGTE